MFVIRTNSGKVSKTLVVGWLEVVAAVAYAVYNFANAGDLSVPALFAIAQALVQIYLRFQTSEPVEGKS